MVKKVKCPVCGKTINSNENIPNTTPTDACTGCISTTVPVTVKIHSGANAKIEALRAAGINVDNLFSMQGTAGEDLLVRMEGGALSLVEDNDPIFADILQSRTIPNRRLFRRWVTAQMFRMLTEKHYFKQGDKYVCEPISFTEALNRKGFKYMWRMVVEEFRVQAKLAQEDRESYMERVRWFNGDVAYQMAQDYIKALEKKIDFLKDSRRVKHCKGVPYIRLYKNNVFVSDIYYKVIRPAQIAACCIKTATNSPAVLYRAVDAFWRHIIKCTYCYSDIHMSAVFKDAYKGAGAYYTLKNLILFHDCLMRGCKTEKTSMAKLVKLVSDPKLQGYELLGVLKDFIEFNHIDIAAKQAEWRKY